MIKKIYENKKKILYFFVLIIIIKIILDKDRKAYVIEKINYIKTNFNYYKYLHSQIEDPLNWNNETINSILNHINNNIYDKNIILLGFIYMSKVYFNDSLNTYYWDYIELTQQENKILLITIAGTFGNNFSEFIESWKRNIFTNGYNEISNKICNEIKKLINLSTINNIFIVGHSQGGGIGCNIIKKLENEYINEPKKIIGLFWNSAPPFNKMTHNNNNLDYIPKIDSKIFFIFSKDTQGKREEDFTYKLWHKKLDKLIDSNNNKWPNCKKEIITTKINQDNSYNNQNFYTNFGYLIKDNVFSNTIFDDYCKKYFNNINCKNNENIRRNQEMYDIYRNSLPNS